MDIAEKIREQIAHHRAELLRLESALEVVTEMGGKPAKKSAPMITVRKIVDHEAAPKAKPQKRPKPDRKSSKKLEAAILADLTANGPSHSRDITARLSADRKSIWNRLYAMHTRGDIVRQESGLYSMPNLMQDDSRHPPPRIGADEAA